MILVDNAGSITPRKFPSVSVNVWIVNKYSCFVRGPHDIIDIFKDHGMDPIWLNNVMIPNEGIKICEILLIITWMVRRRKEYQANTGGNHFWDKLNAATFMKELLDS